MIKQKYPEEFALRDQDKYNYRYSGGEVSITSTVPVLYYCRNRNKHIFYLCVLRKELS